ncbi:hypothetical protein SAMN04487866_1036 [Thermoactinomyces sp. DSM 45891]|uniref:hypothetical protein n=1 Tax=Thermoactinomyces sp. DSM 45891 TaxID=1761907 RepID=UPI00091F2BCB|nr:hypothetical protein [Thermoactinomyces sp. DSM 45891]SFX25971.1 hypothetical protein SAMN04487866_1036 [Thermoactinomyces sp. DSM 45891]
MRTDKTSPFTWVQRSIGLCIYLIITIFFPSPAFMFLLATLYLLCSTVKYEIQQQRSESLIRFAFLLFILGSLHDIGRTEHFGISSFLGGLIGWTILLFVYGRQLHSHLSRSTDSPVEVILHPVVIDWLQRIWGFLVFVLCALFDPYHIDTLIFAGKLYCFISTIKYLLRKQYDKGYTRLSFVIIPISIKTDVGFQGVWQDWFQLVFCLFCFGIVGYLNGEK